MKKFKLIVVGLPIASLVCLALWAYYPAIVTDHDLTFKWEGAIPEKTNFRDSVVSFNECYGAKRLHSLESGTLFRSNEFFSGWNCSKVGHPEVILSLNGYPNSGSKNYCRTANSINVGFDFQTSELFDLEFLDTWDEHPDFVVSVCKNLDLAQQTLNNQKPLLVHCEAGRDRTGAVTAILLALYLEMQEGRLTPKDVEAIECDYRKSKSIIEEKHGRIANFLQEIEQRFGSISNFVHSYCMK